MTLTLIFFIHQFIYYPSTPPLNPAHPSPTYRFSVNRNLLSPIINILNPLHLTLNLHVLYINYVYIDIREEDRAQELGTRFTRLAHVQRSGHQCHKLFR